MVSVLVIPDGAAEPVRAGLPTSLERARTPILDGVAKDGTVRRIATTPPGLSPGSEAGIPTLLGFPPVVALSRGALEAAAHGIALGGRDRAWRVDLRRMDGTRAGQAVARRAVASLQRLLPRHAVHHLRGHRLLVVGAGAPRVAALAGLRAIVWPDGATPQPGALGKDTIMVCARGAAAGCARLLGAEVVVPAGATGGIDTNLPAKREAAVRAIRDGATAVVVHAGAPDEAAHALDAEAKVAALEAVDRELLTALRAEVARTGGTLTICPDHGTDPTTGLHDGAPVPAVRFGAGIPADAVPARMTERAAAGRALLEGVPA